MNQSVTLDKPEAQDLSGIASPKLRRWKFPNGFSYALISSLVVIPCVWQPRIHSVDLPSHTYNAWLTSLLEREPVPGIVIDSLWTNVLFDLTLSFVARITGFAAAETIVVAGTVLAFFFWACVALFGD
jgi:hypothetical protein